MTSTPITPIAFPAAIYSMGIAVEIDGTTRALGCQFGGIDATLALPLSAHLSNGNPLLTRRADTDSVSPSHKPFFALPPWKAPDVPEGWLPLPAPRSGLSIAEAGDGLILGATLAGDGQRPPPMRASGADGSEKRAGKHIFPTAITEAVKRGDFETAVAFVYSQIESSAIEAALGHVFDKAVEANNFEAAQRIGLSMSEKNRTGCFKFAIWTLAWEGNFERARGLLKYVPDAIVLEMVKVIDTHFMIAHAIETKLFDHAIEHVRKYIAAGDAQAPYFGRIMEAAIKARNFESAVSAAMEMGQWTQRYLKSAVNDLVKAGNYDDALALAKNAPPSEVAPKLYRIIASRLADVPRYEEALKIAREMPQGEERDYALHFIADNALRFGDGGKPEIIDPVEGAPTGPPNFEVATRALGLMSDPKGELANKTRSNLVGHLAGEKQFARGFDLLRDMQKGTEHFLPAARALGYDAACAGEMKVAEDSAALLPVGLDRACVLMSIFKRHLRPLDESNCVKYLSRFMLEAEGIEDDTARDMIFFVLANEMIPMKEYVSSLKDRTNNPELRRWLNYLLGKMSR